MPGNKRKRKTGVHDFITDPVKFVINTVNKGKTVIVKTKLNKRLKVTLKKALNNKLFESAEFIPIRIGCKCRLSFGAEPFRLVWWQGFVNPTQEPINFKENLRDAPKDI
jgi:hypothetical protein